MNETKPVGDETKLPGDNGSGKRQLYLALGVLITALATAVPALVQSCQARETADDAQATADKGKTATDKINVELDYAYRVFVERLEDMSLAQASCIEQVEFLQDRLKELNERLTKRLNLPPARPAPAPRTKGPRKTHQQKTPDPATLDDSVDEEPEPEQPSTNSETPSQ